MDRTYKAVISRRQGELIPRQLEDYVSETNPVRAIDAFVESLDLVTLGYTKTRPNKTDVGQPSYPPGALLKLYLYGYLNQVRSSRRLERECHRNLEVIWLIEGLRPTYKTISDFRKENRLALRETHQEFLLICQRLALFGGDCIAVDGSFFKGNVSQKSFKTKQGLDKAIKKIASQIEEWEKAFDQEEEQSVSAADDPALQQKIDALAELQTRKAQKQAALKQLEDLGKTQHSSTDPDARLLNKGASKVRGYNVQIVTDDKHHLIVTDDVTSDPNDLQQLYPMSYKAKQLLGVEELAVLADAGYYSAGQLNDCLKEGMTPYVPIPDTKKNQQAKNGRYQRLAFSYDAQQDTYCCPAGKVLPASGSPRQQNGHHQQRYMGSESDCGPCQDRNKCITQKSSCREIWRSEHEAVLAAHRQRMTENPLTIRKRSGMVEHPFGTLKRRAGWDHFLVRGKEKVQGEWSLMVLTYNLTRVLNILGIERFKEALKNKAHSLLHRIANEAFYPLNDFCRGIMTQYVMRSR